MNGRTETPNKHDILTGTRPDGTAFPGAPFGDMTCGNWTKGARPTRRSRGFVVTERGAGYMFAVPVQAM